MKRNIAAACFLFLFTATVSFAQDNIPFIGEIIRDSVNIRSGANINYEILCKLKLKDKVKVLEGKFGWYKIELPKQMASCFISQEYLNTQDGKTGTVLANRVNLRARSNTGSTILAQVNKGQILEIISKNDGWFEVWPIDNCFGWISQDFVKRLPDLRELPYVEVTTKITPQDSPKDIQKVNIEEVEVQSIDVIGRIKGANRIFGSPATHKLITSDKKIYYLKAEKAFLNDFLHQKVRLQGNISYIQKNKYPLITVERIEALN